MFGEEMHKFNARRFSEDYRYWWQRLFAQMYTLDAGLLPCASGPH
jgi:hypothetical protein